MTATQSTSNKSAPAEVTPDHIATLVELIGGLPALESDRTAPESVLVSSLSKITEALQKNDIAAASLELEQLAAQVFKRCDTIIEQEQQSLERAAGLHDEHAPEGERKSLKLTQGGFSVSVCVTLGLVEKRIELEQHAPNQQPLFSRSLTLDPSDKTIVAALAAQSLHRPFEDITPLQFLAQLAAWNALSADPQKMLAAAEAERIRVASILQPVHDFGNRIPFGVTSSTSSPEFRYFMESTAACEYPVCVLYSRKEGLYFVICLNSLPLQKLGITFPQVQAGALPIPMGTISDIGCHCLSRAETARVVGILEKALGDALPVISDGPLDRVTHIDKIDPHRIFEFFGTDITLPLVAEQTHLCSVNVRLIREHMDESSSRRTASSLLAGSGKQVGITPQVGISPSYGRKQSTGQVLGVQIELEKSIAGLACPPDLTLQSYFETPLPESWARGTTASTIRTQARIVRWANGRHTIHLEKPLEWGTLLRAGFPSSIKSVPSRIATFQTFFDDNMIFPLIDGAKVRRGTTEDAPKPLHITFTEAARLPLDVPINCEPLTPCMSEALRKHGYEANADGVNALSNFNGILIPLVKPPPEDFDLPEFAAIQTLRSVPRRSWDLMISQFNGERISSMLDVPLEELEEVDSGDAKRRKNPPSIKHAHKLGECYDGPHSSIAILGRWIVYECKNPKDPSNPLFVMDSFIPGTAMYIFRSRSVARWAALSHSAQQQTLLEIRNHPECIGKVVHSGDWRGKAGKVLGFTWTIL